jgi:hypothetical protein
MSEAKRNELDRPAGSMRPTAGTWRAAKYPDCKTWTVYSSSGVTVASRLNEADAKHIAARGPDSRDAASIIGALLACIEDDCPATQAAREWLASNTKM